MLECLQEQWLHVVDAVQECCWLLGKLTGQHLNGCPGLVKCEKNNEPILALKLRLWATSTVMIMQALLSEVCHLIEGLLCLKMLSTSCAAASATHRRPGNVVCCWCPA
jgi:hypothetical protein